MGLSHTISEIDFSGKSQIFPNLSPLKVFPLDLGIGTHSCTDRLTSQKTRMMVLPGQETSLIISLTVWIQYTNVTDGQADGRTPGNSKDHAYVKMIPISTFYKKLS